MTETTPHDLELHGCTPEPLMAYLKALGVLRLVSEQKDSDARGWWKNDVFWLRSKLNHEGLVEFFLEEYKPTPIVAPWGGGSGFFAGDNSGAVSSLCNSDLSRCKSYSDVILHVRRIIEGERITKKPKDEGQGSAHSPLPAGVVGRSSCLDGRRDGCPPGRAGIRASAWYGRE